MESSGKIVVVGSYIVALVMETERLPQAGETLVGRGYHSAYGGKGSNQAVQAARLGGRVELLTRIGKDAAGEEFLRLCRREGISDRYVGCDPEAPTATGFIICSAAAQNIITIDIGALARISKKHVNRALESVAAGDVVLLQFEIPVEMALYAAEVAHRKKAVVVLNPAPAHDLSVVDLSMVDYLTPNETEARVCLGLPPSDPESEERLAGRLLEKGCRNVLVTLGERGALLCNRGGCHLYKPVRLEKAVDSTGAGDAFNGALAVALSEKRPVDEAVRFANAVAAFACTGADTIPSYGTRSQIEAFLHHSR